MKCERLLETLSNQPSTQDLRDLGIVKSVALLMSQDPQMWIDFINQRMNTRFQTNSEVSAHFNEMVERSGIPAFNLKKLIVDFELATLKLGNTYDKEQERKKSYLEKKNRLEAALRVIRGYGTAYDIAKEFRINHRTLYRDVDRLLAEQDLETSQLNAMFAPDRAAVAEIAYINENKRLDNFLNKVVTREPRYRRKT